MSKKTVIQVAHLRVFKAAAGTRGLNYDENGNVKNDNQLVKLIVVSREFDNYINLCGRSGHAEVRLERLLNVDILSGDSEDAPEKDFDEVAIRIGTAFHGKLFPEKYKEIKAKQKKAADEAKAKEEAAKKALEERKALEEEATALGVGFEKETTSEELQKLVDVAVEKAKKELSEAQSKFEKLTGQKPGNMKLETLLEKIAKAEGN